MAVDGSMKIKRKERISEKKVKPQKGTKMELGLGERINLF